MGVGVMEEAAPATATAAGSTKPSMTYVQADTSNFREVVQRLTGPSRNDVIDDGGAVAAAATARGVVMGVKRPAMKLHERRQYARTKLEIVKPPPPPPLLPDCHVDDHHCYYYYNQQQHHFNFFPSPPGYGSGAFIRSQIGTPSSIFSRLSIVEEVEEEEKDDEEMVAGVLNREEEEKAIRERRFYLHPSPRSKPGFTEPELLTLFPLTSPKTTHGS